MQDNFSCTRPTTPPAHIRSPPPLTQGRQGAGISPYTGEARGWDIPLHRGAKGLGYPLTQGRQGVIRGGSRRTSLQCGKGRWELARSAPLCSAGGRTQFIPRRICRRAASARPGKRVRKKHLLSQVLFCHRVALSIFEPPALFRSCSVKNSTSFQVYYNRNTEGGQEVISADMLHLSVCVSPATYLPVPFSNAPSAAFSSKLVTT